MYVHKVLLFTCCLLIGEVRSQEEVINLQDNLNGGFPGVLFQNKCISDLGCFWTGPPFFHPVHRPISRIPTHTRHTRFLLYTPLNTRTPHLLNLTAESVQESRFMRATDTKVLVHGYVVQLREEEDIRFWMKDELLAVGAYNVIIVDWSAHNRFPYSQAVANARVVAAQIAKLILLLMAHKDLRPEMVHLIGHSLGGQISGWVGERVPNIGRITGLDPAGPFFQNAENEVRLDTTDAAFVDVIHTNGGDNPIEGLGIRETIGHMDFFPNGGSHQPGCLFNIDTLMMDEHGEYPMEQLVANSCDHSRANLLFLESIRNCTFHAHQCDTYSHFESGECPPGGAVVEMGLRTTQLNSLHNKFFLRTRRERPFCME